MNLQHTNYKMRHSSLELCHPFLPASGQQHLAVHLHRGLPAKLSPCQIGVVGGADEVVGQRLVHFLVQLEPVQENWSVFV